MFGAAVFKQVVVGIELLDQRQVRVDIHEVNRILGERSSVENLAGRVCDL